MEFVSRDGWGATPPRWGTPIARSDGMFLHYDGGNPLPSAVVSGDFDAVCRHLRNTQRFHMGPQRGWPDIAYSWAVDGAGRVYELRGWGVEGAHTYGWNSRSHAIYFPLGGEQAPTEQQVAAVRTVIAEHNRRYGDGFIKGHQQAPNSTSCPGPAVMAGIAAGDFAPRPEPSPVPPSPGGEPVKPEMHRDPNTGTIWLLYPGTPWRTAVKSEDDVRTYQFFGVPYRGNMEPAFRDFTLRNTQWVRTG